jgi:hypothetical protein
MDNTITVGEIKRRGMAAIEEALRRGPVHLIKRNRRAAVILSEQQYQQVMSRQPPGEPPTESAIAWLLSRHGGGELSKTRIDEALQRERDW